MDEKQRGWRRGADAIIATASGRLVKTVLSAHERKVSIRAGLVEAHPARGGGDVVALRRRNRERPRPDHGEEYGGNRAARWRDDHVGGERGRVRGAQLL